MIQSIVESAVRDVLFGKSKAVPDRAETPAIKIVVLGRGWIVVGRVSYDDGWTVITDAAVIRNWGTTRGLGEIAANGPTEKTILDKCPTVRAKNTILEMTCEAAKWTL